MKTQKQPHILNRQWLYARGYTVRQAAKAINRSPSHVAYVVSGKRSSRTIESLLYKLPRRPLNLRERVAAH